MDLSNKKNIGLALEEEKAAMPDLKFYASNILSLEFDAGQMFRDIPPYFLYGINNFGNILKGYIKPLVPSSGGYKTELEVIDDGYNAIIKEVLGIKDILNVVIDSKPAYSIISKIEIPVILGLDKDLLTTFRLFKVTIDDINKHMSNVLKDTELVLSKVIADPDYRTQSRTINDVRGIAELDKSLDLCLKTLINNKAVKDRLPISSLLPNISCTEDIYDIIANITKGFTVNKLREIDNYILAITAKTDTIYKYASDDEYKDKFKLSDQVIDHVTDVLYQTGDIITDYIAIMHLVNQCSTTFKATIEAISISN